MPLTYVDAASRRVAQEEVVEGRPRHLPGLRRADARGDAEVGMAFDRTVAGHERRAPFLGKASLPHQVVSADRAEHVVDGREQRFADVEPREPFALEKDHPMSRSREPGGRRRTSGAAADDDHLAVE